MPSLPSFLVIGTGKSGTSSIHEYLRQHPLISLPRRKETHFFICDRDSDFSGKDFEGRVLEDPIDNLADYLADYENKPDACFFGEVCPTYIFVPTTPANIKKYIPDVKIVAILRNPVDRLYSNYNFNTEDNSLKEFTSLINGLPRLPAYGTNFRRWVLEGFYAGSLECYYSHFPAGSIKVFLFDDLIEDPGKLMGELLDFVGIPQYEFNTGQKFNTSGKIRLKLLKRFIKRIGLAARLRRLLPVKTYQKLRASAEKFFFKKSDPIPADIRRKLMEYYKEDILATQNLIQRDLSAWLN